MHGPPTACKHTVSGSISLPSQGCFSPFPRGTSSLSVAREYLALESGLPSFPRDFPCPVVLRIPASSPVSFWLRGSHTLWPCFPANSPSFRIGNSTHAVLQPPDSKNRGLGCSDFARRYSRNLG